MKIVLRPGALNAFGPVLKRIREQSRHRLTQADIAARITAIGLPIDRTIVSRIENGRRALSDIELLYFVKALRISLPHLFALAAQRLGTRYAEPLEEDEHLDIKVAEHDAEPRR